MAQLVCRYRKALEVRWISHLDLTRTFERAMRRAGLPLELTQGYNPRPKVSFGPPLPMGATGEGELLAVQLAASLAPAEVKDRLNAQLPEGITVTEVWVSPPQRKKETFGEIDLAEYQITVEGEVNPERTRAGVEHLLGSEQILIERGGERPERTVNLRPFLLSLAVAEASADRIVLRARLRTGSHGGARPQEIVELLELARAGNRMDYHRTGMFASADAPVEEAKSHGVWRRWTRSRTSRGRH